MKIAIDFDGTIAKRKGIPTIHESTQDLEPMDGARESLEALINDGHEIYILTTHEPLEEVNEWLEIHGFPHGFKVTNVKQSGTQVYIDDRAIRFTNWQDVRKYFI